MAESVFSAADASLQELVAFLEERPDVEDYARFRSVRSGGPWHSWPAAARDGRLDAADVDKTEYRLHLYLQWALSRQLEELAASAGEGGVALYLDLPVGSHALGYDTWRHRDVFISGLACGAPPDLLNVKGVGPKILERNRKDIIIDGQASKSTSE